MPKHILLLDDDPYHLEDLGNFLESEGFTTARCQNVKLAKAAVLDGVDFAIVDLFLEGDDGDELSNGFIEAELIPRNIPYGRMSSAPGLIPQALRGDWVLDKRVFRSQPSKLLDLLLR